MTTHTMTCGKTFPTKTTTSKRRANVDVVGKAAGNSLSAEGDEVLVVVAVTIRGCRGGEVIRADPARDVTQQSIK